MGKWCPKCAAEYVEGWGKCSTCGIELVDERPTVGTTDVPVADVAEPEDRGEDPFVPVWEGPTTEAARIAEVIERSHIPVDLGEATETGHSRVEVPRSYIVEAKDAMAGRGTTWPTPIADETGFDWRPGVRLALVIVAVGLIVLLLFA